MTALQITTIDCARDDAGGRLVPLQQAQRDFAKENGFDLKKP